MSGLESALYTASVWVIPVLLAITLHEAAHGYVALKLGDDTALSAGRVTFNPLKHIDRFGTILLPALLLLVKSPFLFGYAKPVPVNFARLNNPRRDMIWVAAAGPATNLIIATVSALLLHLIVLFPAGAAAWIGENLRNSVLINVVLAVFNMLPLPPLDGGRVAVGLLPDMLAFRLARLERWGLFIIIGAMFVLPYVGGRLGVNLEIFPWLIGAPVNYLIGVIATLTGHG
ncbi:MAG: site-2 protease family protein [Proteobacteria bacterium]|nr:site-2 protease family protein [Pseudomonadota bacterium]